MYCFEVIFSRLTLNVSKLVPVLFLLFFSVPALRLQHSTGMIVNKGNKAVCCHSPTGDHLEQILCSLS